ncbi:MAG: glycosyltransferase family 4 protein [Nitrospirota bacterium]
MSQINVLWVIDHVCYDGSLHGGGRLYWNILPRFDKDRFNIVPCLLRASDTIRQVFEKSPVPVRILDKGKFDPTTLLTFLRLIKEENIHVMHLHCYGASTFGRLAGLITGVPTIVHDYDTEVYFPYPWYLGAADRLLASVTRRAIAPSPMVRDFLIRKRKIDSGRIEMLFHAVPSEKYVSIPGETIIRTRDGLGIDEDARIIGTVTKLGPQRGNEYLLNAAGEVLKSIPNTLFLLVYKPTYFHRLPNQKYLQVSSSDVKSMLMKLEALVREIGIEKNVRLVEWPENITELVSACDFIVAPFLSERFSSVNLLEAMAMGKPLIATDLGEQREIIKNGINGYLVCPGDVKELAKKIIEVITRPGELERLSRHAKVMAEVYSVDAYVQKLQRTYKELATNRKKEVKDEEKRSG